MKLRKIEESDRPKIDAFIAADPWHAGKGSSDYFFEPFSESMAVEDDSGNVVFFRIARALRVNAVFQPDARDSNKKIVKHMAEFFAKGAKNSGIREVLFTSENPALRKFGTTVGFVEQPDLVMNVEPAVKD